MNNEFYLPTYIINLPERTDRRTHMESQLVGHEEFALSWIEASRHPVGAIGLWQSIVTAVQTAREREDDVMLLCEDDHYFTEHYAPRELFLHINDAYAQGAQLLSGGIGGFGSAFPVAPGRFWMDWYWSNQFIILYREAYSLILDYSFRDTDTADGVLSGLLSNKMTIWPFISRQANFGYSDVTSQNNATPAYIDQYFESASRRLDSIEQAFRLFYPEG